VSFHKHSSYTNCSTLKVKLRSKFFESVEIYRETRWMDPYDDAAMGRKKWVTTDES
jgi:protein involved in temperature-dependent protein secretion